MWGLELHRPLGLLALALPVLLLLFSKRRERPTSLATGAFALWEGLPASERGAGRRRRIPRERWLIIFALASGALALSDPRPAVKPPRRTWHVVVDVSPSMYLGHGPLGTRMEAACEVLYGLAASGGVRLTWSQGGSGAGMEADRLPPSFSMAPSRPQAEPNWAAVDRAGVVWLTDRVPGVEPRRAGLVASGGPPVPGAIGTRGPIWLDWDGEVVSERGGAPVRALRLSTGLPAPVRQVATAWAEERGLGLSGGAVALSLEAVSTHGAGPVRASRDGWSLTGSGGQAPASHGGRPCTTWLAGGDPPRPLITWVTGHVWVALGGISDPLGGADAWAVSWAELLDDALLPLEGVVSSTERAEAGEGHVLGPQGETGSTDGSTGMPAAALLSGLASGLALLALVLGRGRL